MTVDVIIPTYKPGRELFGLLDALNRQSVVPDRIILMNTEEKYFEQLTYGTDFARRFPTVCVYHLSKREFNHGMTRRRAVAKSGAECFVMMTQDARPRDAFLLERLVEALQGERVAVAYARQLPGEDSSILERFARQFNYPAAPLLKTAADKERLGIKTYFCSDVCAAYRRDLYDELGGFVRHTIFNEDMIFAATAIEAGYGVYYAADAQVVHAHNYTCMQQFRRNFDLGVSQADHPEIFGKVKSESEGMRLVKEATAHLIRERKLRQIPYFYLQCGFKYAGYLLGKRYRRLPKRMILWCSADREYWRKKRG